MPTPKKNESEKDFISRCIPYVIKEGTTDDTSQAAAICHSIWRKSKEKNKMKKNRVLLHLNTRMFKPLDLRDDEKQNSVEFDRSTIIVGDGTYNGLFFPKEELEIAYQTWDKQPINLDHSEKIEDIVGYIKKPVYDKVNNKITVKPIIVDYMPKAPVAHGYIASRLQAGSIPEVSIGVWVDRMEEEVDGETRLTARNLQGDHLALVTRGACSPEDGCGIGLEKNDTVTIPDEDYVNMNKKIEGLQKEILKEQIKKYKEEN